MKRIKYKGLKEDDNDDFLANLFVGSNRLVQPKEMMDILREWIRDLDNAVMISVKTSNQTILGGQIFTELDRNESVLVNLRNDGEFNLQTLYRSSVKRVAERTFEINLDSVTIKMSLIESN